jgi:asparagine synthase (glutamine-hydrolysing)
MLPFAVRRVKTLAMAMGERDFGGISLAERDEILGRHATATPSDMFPFSANHLSALRRILFYDQTSWLPDNLLERGDRMMMAGSIEGRMPFMDVELARVAARLPDSFLVNHPGAKAILRRAMARILPHRILERKKIGFRVPISEWFRNVYRDSFLDLLSSDASEVRRLCHAPTLDRLVGEHVMGRQNHEKILWSLANLEMFLRSFRPVVVPQANGAQTATRQGL